MGKNLETRLIRFIELSKQFCKVPEVVENLNSNIIVLGYVNGSIYADLSSNQRPVTYTNSQLIQNKANLDKEKADNWDEYLELQKDLEFYFQALKQVEK